MGEKLTAKEISVETGNALPNSTKAVTDWIDRVKKETSLVSEKLIIKIKNKVGRR